MKFKGANFLSKVFHFYNRIGDHPGKLRVVNYLHGIFRNQIRFIGPNGTLLQIVPKDFISRKIIVENIYEPQSLALTLALLKDAEGIFLDVGANIGLYTSIVAKSYPHKQVISIEPEENNFKVLAQNVAKNESGNQVTILNIAVGECVKLIQLECPVANNNGTYRVVTKPGTETLKTKFYPMFDLDTVLKNLAVKRIAVMKIDIEGYEMEAFKGMDWSAAYKPQNIVMEYSDYVNRTGTSAEEMLDYLTDKGYSAFTIEKRPYSKGDPLPEDNLWLSLSGADL
jgi:FkbM family methyltransferase